MRIIYEDEEGLKVIIPAPWWETNLSEIALRTVPSGIPFHFVDDFDIPTDRTFRNAWKDGNGKVDIDMPKARNIWREKIRQARAGVLAQNDIAMQNAIADNDQPARQAAIAMRNKLRDMPQDPRIEAAKTPDELKAVWFAELG